MNVAIGLKALKILTIIPVIMTLGGEARAESTDTTHPELESTDAASIETVSAATVQQPRPFGYVLGDIVTQRILLRFGESQFDPADLPPYERIGVWLERRTPRLDADADGRLWLAVDYQIISAPQSFAPLTIPEWKLADKSGMRALKIAAWTVNVAPLSLSDPSASNVLEALRPDRPAPLLAITPIRQRITFWSGALLLTLTLWLSWYAWRTWRASSTQPFAVALREVRRLGDTAPEAWRALHRAFDRTAGQTVHASTLDTLFGKAPHLIPLRAQIAQFFAQSNDLFFGSGLPSAPVSVRELSVKLRRIEKRVER